MSTAIAYYNHLPVRQLTPPDDSDDQTDYCSDPCPSLSTPRRTRKLPPIVPVSTHMLTPPCTPGRGAGPLLLPRIRAQDQALDLSAGSRSVSLGPYSSAGATTYPRVASVANTHHRVTSLPSLTKHLTAIEIPAGRQYTLIQLPAIAAVAPHTPPSPVPVTPSILFSTYATEPPTTTLLTYLTSPNPSPALVSSKASSNHDLQTLSYWWDIRNLRPWTTFTPTTIHSIPGITALLNLPIPAPALSTPQKTTSTPESLEELTAGHTEFYAKKVNSALKVALGAPILSMQPTTATGPSKTKHGNPDFATNYAADHEPLIFSQPRARVVGLTCSFHAWNSGMRGEGTSGGAQTAYLRPLARLHGMMRERGCRYGFLLTEIELVCVRLGGDAAESSIPVFGYLELTSPIPLAEHGGGGHKLTACLALWYLNMLAKSVALPGQLGARVEVGGPAAVTRKKCFERDSWIGRPEGRERREAKRRRGWVWPGEALSRRELGGGRVRAGKVS